MRERPILFSGPMVRAIIEGRKTVTRRVVKPRDLAWMDEHQGLREPCNAIRCPYGQTGDRLWVRETFAVYGNEKMAAIHYRADRPHHVGQKGMGYKPSFHMPRWASRILLEITAVRVERLQDISQEQAMAEGVLSCESALDPDGNGYSPYELFSALWVSINGHDSWHANPWVWVVEFKRVEVGNG